MIATKDRLRICHLTGQLHTSGAERLPLSVVHVVLSLDCGGLERVVLSLVKAGMRAGQSVSIICLERPGHLADQAREQGATVMCIYKESGIRPSTFGRLRRWLIEVSPDVVHTHQLGALFYTGIAARTAGVPLLVHTEHGKHYQSRKARILGRIAAASANKFFCVSNDIARDAVERKVVSKSKVAVVPNGVDTDHFRTQGESSELRERLNIPVGAPVVGTVGRLAEVKQQHVLIKAFARLKALHPAAHLVLVGDGPLRPELEQLAGEVNVRDCTHFVGFQPDAAPYLQLLDVFVLCSRSEGMPLAVLEAWAAGVVVVATAVGGLPELIDDGETGILYTGDDAVLARRMEAVLCDCEWSQRMTSAARARVIREFSANAMAQNYANHYLRLLERRCAARRSAAAL
jgi:glycosyltransferase involved in cell wall biosynthesis